MCKDIVVFGVGGFGREIMEELYQKKLISNEYNILGFVDDDIQVQGKEINGFKVVGKTDYLLKKDNEIAVLVCVGEPIIKQKIINKLKTNKNIKFPNFISRNTLINERLLKMGEGNIIYCNSFLSVNIKMGDFNYINCNCSLSHDVTLENHVTLSPSVTICGSVTLKDNSYIGSNTTIRENLTIGKNSIVGMGSNVTKDVPDNVVAYGNPCKVQRVKEADDRVFR